MTIPTTIEAISPAILSGALQASGFADAEVSAIHAERIAVGDGFLGVLARLSIEYAAGAGPATVIAKIPATDSGLKSLGDMLDVYNREHRAYAEIIPRIRMRTPAAYYNVGDPNSGAYCLILEDLGSLTAGDHHAGGTLEQAKTAIVAAAGLHSRWWGKVDEFDWVPPIDSPLNMGLGPLIEATWPAVVDTYGDLLGPEVLARIESFIPHVNDFLTSYGQQSRTLVHNDFRLDNMFFDESGAGGSELVLLDWQVIGRGDGMGDLCPFLSSNFDSDLRREHETDLFRMYHELMAAAGAGYYEYDDLIGSYRVSLNFWLAHWCSIAVNKGETTPRGEELFQRMLSRTADAYMQHAAWEVAGDFEPHDRMY